MTEVKNIEPGTVVASSLVYGATPSLGIKTKIVPSGPTEAYLWETRGYRFVVAVQATYSPVAINITYGIAMCSPDDNFNWKEGKRKAIERLMQGFGVVLDYPEKDPRRAAKKMLASIHDAIAANPRKFKKRIVEWNKSHPLSEKVVDKTPKRSKYILKGVITPEQLEQEV